jgi:hypothetical protein
MLFGLTFLQILIILTPLGLTIFHEANGFIRTLLLSHQNWSDLKGCERIFRNEENFPLVNTSKNPFLRPIKF